MNRYQSPAFPGSPLACSRLVTQYANPGACAKVTQSPTLNGQTGVMPLASIPAEDIVSFIASDSVMNISDDMSALLGDGCCGSSIVCQGRAGAIQQVSQAAKGCGMR